MLNKETWASTDFGIREDPGIGFFEDMESDCT